MATEMITLRVTPEQKGKLESLATQQGHSVSDVIRAWIDGDSVVNSIPSKLMAQIESEAVRRNISTRQLLTKLVVAGFGRLRKDTPKNVFVLR